MSRVFHTQRQNRNKEARYWIVTNTNDIAKPVKSTLKKYIHPAMIDWSQQGRDGRFLSAKDSGGTLFLKNGAILEFKSFAQGEALVSAPLAGWWVDEAARCDDTETWANLYSRLNATGGWGIMTTSPAGRGVFFKEYVRANKKNPDYGWHSWTSEDAVSGGIMLAADLESARRRLPPQMFAREHDASWSMSAGQVWPNFSEERHVVGNISPEHFNSNTYRFGSLDLGADHPTSLQIFSRLGDKRNPRYAVHKDVRLYTPSMTEIIETTSEAVREHDLRRLYYDYPHIGKLFWNEWLKSPMTKGIKNRLHPAFKSQVAGASFVYDAFSADAVEIHYSCTHLIEEVQDVQWSGHESKDEFADLGNDDSADAFRYGIASDKFYSLGLAPVKCGA